MFCFLQATMYFSVHGLNDPSLEWIGKKISCKNLTTQTFFFIHLRCSCSAGNIDDNDILAFVNDSEATLNRKCDAQTPAQQLTGGSGAGANHAKAFDSVFDNIKTSDASNAQVRFAFPGIISYSCLCMDSLWFV